MEVKKGQIWILPKDSKYIRGRPWRTHGRRVIRITEVTELDARFVCPGELYDVRTKAVYIQQDFEFLAWEKGALTACPSCSEKLSPTLFDHLMICPGCGEKFRQWVTWKDAKDWFKD